MSSSKTSLTVGVSGMTCGSCVNTVTNAIKTLGSDVEATVNLASGTAHVTGSSVTFDSVKEAIEACGFTVGPCGSSGTAKGGKCSAGEKCTCGDNCQCGTNCRCDGCSGACGESKEACSAKAAGTCTCGEVCTCGPNCSCVGCPGNKTVSCGTSGGACPAKAAGTCTCGPNCACGPNCNCATCPGGATCGVSGGACPAKAAGTCTCGPNCACGSSCSCAGCPGKDSSKLITKTNAIALAVVGAAVLVGFALGRRK